MTVHLFGLTGGIASGKSTVASRWRARRLPVIDADALAREVVAPGTVGLRQLVSAFGGGVLGAQGELDRKALARIAFADAAALRSLNAITHPLIAARAAERALELDRVGEPLACYEAALLVENGVAAAFRPLVVCSCPEDVQEARVLARDAYAAHDAFARIRAQMPLAAKVALADYVIDTGGTLADSSLQADRVLRAICASLGVDAERYA
ncbi:MAG: dephospho-CoA kinase [Myxococcota bacterium]|nr:dephospho-CoA kinase [Myxococcota bacterium]